MKPSLLAPKNTLAYQLARPLCRANDISSVPCSETGKVFKAFFAKDTNPGAVPEESAITFYLLQHAVGDLRKKFHMLEPLPIDALKLIETYHAEACALAERSFVYLLIICTREMRHLKSSAKTKALVAGLYGQQASDYLCSIPDDATTAMKTFPNAPPNSTLGAYCQALCYGFHKGSWGGGYGGKAWGSIADCMKSYVFGEYTPEVMLDVSFTLSHNNGPIYNKGMNFGMYGSYFLWVLDVQRSGQIPQMVHQSHEVGMGKYVTDAHRAWLQTLWELCPPDHQELDYPKIQALGGKGAIAPSKPKSAKPPPPPVAQKLPPGAEAWLGTVQIMPKVILKTLKMQRAA
ncbi:hypothetical protein [Roseococcus pinisoli]|uniref:Uncharacterized protein n=1 Tax=Roseococcus pinisoli TaxID=2835040 RepID=A0ABS5QFU0_9PROT|nr:hypothetical protein [Roseococcus pinisoli]MBS7812368.1 hypothetical protein [Roseococcus pinisoli]